VLRTLERERKREKREHATSLDAAPDPRLALTFEEELIAREEMPFQSLEELMPFLEEHFSDEELDLVVGTYGKGKKVADLAREQLDGGDDEAQVFRLGNRLRRRRSRLMCRIRKTVQQAVADEPELEQPVAA
jgi:hypothetical protein